ncbi:MAG: hypothetical protein RBU37_07100 [Myxococcota bacterium]|jgi:hypothetical protein|nr:hypothetical protein [Myxococcota bacterium]
MATPSELLDASQTVSRQQSHVSIRAILESAWTLCKQQWELSVWDFLASSLANGVWIASLFVIVFALLRPLAWTSNSADFLLLLSNGAQSPAFIWGIIGLLFVSLALHLAADSAVAAGIFGRLTQAADERRAQRSFWEQLIAAFPRMLGWNALRLCFLAALLALGVSVVLLPAGKELLAQLDGHATHWPTVVLVCAGAALFLVVAWLLAILSTQMGARLCWHNEPLPLALAHSARDLGARLGRYLRLSLALLLLSSPIFIVYLAFSLMSGLLASQPQYATLALLLRLTLDLALAVSLSLMRVFAAATFVLDQAEQDGCFQNTARMPHLRKTVQRRPLRLGEAISMPALGQASIVLMPMSSVYPALLSISELFPHLLDESALPTTAHHQPESSTVAQEPEPSAAEQAVTLAGDASAGKDQSPSTVPVQSKDSEGHASSRHSEGTRSQEAESRCEASPKGARQGRRATIVAAERSVPERERMQTTNAATEPLEEQSEANSQERDDE